MRLKLNTLVVVASGEIANVYRNKAGRLELTETWTPDDLEDDAPSGNLPPEKSEKDIDEATFSKQLAGRLNVIARQEDVRHIALIADPTSLGEIRPQLDPRAEKKIALQIPKTFVNSPIADIEKAINAAP